jgi:CRP/FNR family transcriptional regulator, cyclic AMP receptor protein
MSWLLDTVPPSERAQTASALASCAVLALPEGSSLGDDRLETVSLLSIEDGIVFVSASNENSLRQIVVAVAGPGSILLAPAARETLVALTDSRVTLITARALRRLLTTSAAATSLLEGVEAGLRDCRESLGQFGSRHHVDRVREKLTQLARIHGKVATEGLLLDIPLTHELLADMVGSTRETVTRALAQLAEQGLVQHEPGRYRVAAPPQPTAP